MTAPYLVTGRYTRAYPVYEKATNNLKYFLKDLWRAHGSRLDPEAGIFQRLAEQQVEHVHICGGDLNNRDLSVPEERNPPADKAVPCSKAPCPQDKDWSHTTWQINYRFAVDFIGKPLSDFEGSRELMQVVFDAFTASQQTYEKCKMIHSDITPGNILIDKNGRGVLDDWDLAKREDEFKQFRRDERTGTWQFMSYRLLSQRHYIHTIHDDMESFVHIMLYFGLRYLQHNSTKDIPNLLNRIFDDDEFNTDEFVTGGGIKRSLFNEPANILGDGFEFSSGPFQSWCEWAFKAAQSWILYQTNATKKKPTRPPIEAFQDEIQQLVLSFDPTKLGFFSHANMAKAFSQCLSQPDWPLNEPRPIDAAPNIDW